MQMQDSRVDQSQGNVLPTGAAESTESHTFVHAGPAPLHGFIQLICSLANRNSNVVQPLSLKITGTSHTGRFMNMLLTLGSVESLCSTLLTASYIIEFRMCI